MQIFSLLYMLPVNLVIVSFAAEKLFSLISSHLLIFASVACAFTGLVSYPKKSLPSIQTKYGISDNTNARMIQTLI